MPPDTDLIKFWCALCELDWDVWGTQTGSTFRAEQPDADRCPSCLRRGVPRAPESLA